MAETAILEFQLREVFAGSLVITSILVTLILAVLIFKKWLKK